MVSSLKEENKKKIEITFTIILWWGNFFAFLCIDLFLYGRWTDLRLVPKVLLRPLFCCVTNNFPIFFLYFICTNHTQHPNVDTKYKKQKKQVIITIILLLLLLILLLFEIQYKKENMQPHVTKRIKSICWLISIYINKLYLRYWEYNIENITKIVFWDVFALISLNKMSKYYLFMHYYTQRCVKANWIN